MVPVRVGEAVGAPPAEVISAVSSTTAPVRVLKLVTAPPAAAIALCTNCVVAINVVLSVTNAVGAVGVPVSAELPHVYVANSAVEML
jgi:hypothetical protein